jgi:hypothetical protein
VLPIGKRRSGPRPPIVADVVGLAAAAEGELAYEGDKLGLFTAALLTALSRHDGDDPTYAELMQEVAALLELQRPTYRGLGQASPTGEGRTPLKMVGKNVTSDGAR